MDFLPYVYLPVKRATYYDFVLIDGICKHYAAYHVIVKDIVDYRFYHG